MKLSEREKTIPPSPIRFLWKYAEKAREKGIEVYHLNIGQPDIETPFEIRKAIKNFDEPVLPYGPSEGVPELREIIAEYFKRYGVPINPEEVFITVGGSEAILFALIATCDVGDNILIPEPFYTNYHGFTKMSGVEIVPIPTRVEEGFHLPSRKVIEDLVNRRTKGILICSPNNPTGTVYEEKELEMLVEIAEKNELFILADEVYREFVFDGLKPRTILELSQEENIIVLDSISKRFSACGARIGFAVTKNRRILDSFLRMGQARLCPPTIEQIGAKEGFKFIDKFIMEMKEEYERRRDAVLEELQKIEGIVSHKPQGAFYTVIKLPVEDATHFSKWILTDFSFENRTVMLAPARPFYVTQGRGQDEVRIAFVLDVQKLRKAITILKEALESYRVRCRNAS